MAKPMVVASMATPLATPLAAGRPASSLAARVASRPAVPLARSAGRATLPVDLVGRARDDRRAPVSGT
jgi:hypothetical protein